jgi:hypothetical protein
MGGGRYIIIFVKRLGYIMKKARTNTAIEKYTQKAWTGLLRVKV